MYLVLLLGALRRCTVACTRLYPPLLVIVRSI